MLHVYRATINRLGGYYNFNAPTIYNAKEVVT